MYSFQNLQRKCILVTDELHAKLQQKPFIIIIIIMKGIQINYVGANGPIKIKTKVQRISKINFI